MNPPAFDHRRRTRALALCVVVGMTAGILGGGALGAAAQTGVPPDSTRVTPKTPSRASGAAVVTLKGPDSDHIANLSELLRARVPGLEVTGGSGEAGQGKQLRIRGNGSITLGNRPLIYIDGVRMMEDAFPASPLGFTNLFGRGAHVSPSALDMVDPTDVERIEVYRGPAAAGRFGVGASTGVIHIQTRRGSRGPARWTSDMQQGTGWVQPFGVNGVDYLHTEHYLRDAWWGGGYEGGALADACVTDDPRWDGANRDPAGACSWPGAQWYQSYRLSVSGGDDELDYFVSGRLQDDTYALPGDALEKRGVRANLGFRPSAAVSLRFHTAFVTQHTSNTPSGNNAEGIELNAFRQEANYLGSADPRVIADLLGYQNDTWADRLTTILTASHTSGSGWTQRITAGYDFSRQDASSLRELGFPTWPQGSVTNRSWQRRLVTGDYSGAVPIDWTPQLRSTLAWGAHAVGDEVVLTGLAGNGLPGPGPWPLGSAATIQSLGARDESWSAGVSLGHTLAVSGRYFLSAGVRLEEHRGSLASFGPIAHPSADAVWSLSDESFWPRALGTLSLRAAWGRSANAPAPLDPAVASLADDPFNPDPTPLGPELSTEWEAGLDATWLDDRVSLALTRYVQRTDHALVRVATAPSQSLGSATIGNVGKLRNQGVEVQLDAALLRGPRWRADLSLALATNHSEVESLGGAFPYDDLNGRIVVGQPVPVNWGRRVADPEAVLGPWNGTRYAVGGNGVPGSSAPLGPQLPTHVLTIAPSLGLRWGAEISALGEYRGGNMRQINPIAVSRSVRSPLCYPYYVDPNRSIDLRPDTPDLWRERCTPSGGSDYWFDGDYFELRNVSLALPVGWLFPERMSDARLTVTVANAFSWYREIPWWNPEILGNDGPNDDGLGSAERIPAPATLRLALRVVF